MSGEYIAPAFPKLVAQIEELRSAEYARRLSRLKGRRQELEPRTRPTDRLHVVYVMAHVGVTGGAKVIFDHANHLSDQGVKVTIVCHYPKPAWYPVRCDYRQIPFEVELAAGIPACDVIVATYWDHIQACVETGLAPVVYFEQGDFHLFETLKPETLEIVRSQIQSAAQVVTCSHRMADIIRERFGRDVARVFPNAVDPRVFHPNPSTGEGLPNKPYLMMMGSDAVPFKGTSDVLQAWRLVRESGMDLDLVWVSPVPLRQPEGQVYINPDQRLLAELYRNAAVFVSGSRYEAFPLPPLEAMASGCPVVSTANEGVLTYAVDGQNCLLAEIGNPPSLAQQIIRLMKDEALRKRLREQGLRTAARYTWTKTTEALRDYYAGLSRFRPKVKNNLGEWKVTSNAFLAPDDWERLKRLLQWTEADVVLAPSVAPAFEGHLLARWNVVARRKGQTDGRAVQLWLPVSGEMTDVPYLPAWRLFVQGRYREALRLFQAYFRLAHDPNEQVVYIRWIILCLIELNMESQAIAILQDALLIHSTNTDLCYLFGIVLSLMGRWDEIPDFVERIVALGDSAAYPEFFWGVQSLAVERLHPRDRAGAGVPESGEGVDQGRLRSGTQDDWTVIPSDRFLQQEDAAKLGQILSSSSASVILAPVIYDVFGYQVARWEPVARRTDGVGETIEKVTLFVRGEGHHPWYADACQAVQAGNYAEALSRFLVHYHSASDPLDQAVLVRWMALCLVQLERKDEAIQLLVDAIQLFPDYSDLRYLLFHIVCREGVQEGVQELVAPVLQRGDSVEFPEFIVNVRQLLVEFAPSTVI